MKRVLRAAAGDPTRLVALLVERLQLPLGTVTRMIAAGGVELEGSRQLRDTDIATGTRIVAFVPDAKPTIARATVAFQDDHVLVLDKPAGLRSQGVRGDEGDTLLAHAQALVPSATLLHRLDRDTSGLVIFPLRDRAREGLQRALDTGAIDRRYVARVQGTLIESRRIALRIARDPRDPRRRVARPENDSVGETALTLVTPLRSDGSTSTVELQLETGRTHQLRVHLAAIGHPIVGDATYGGPLAERLCLHALRVTFPHPITGAETVVTSPIPALME